MAEGLLGGILGDDDEKPEVEAPEGVSGADAFAAAIAHHASIQNPEVARDASAFLRGQLHHVKVQTRPIEEDMIEAPTGSLALTVRGNGVPPKTFSGSATELEKLTVEAAEYVYSKSQPARWATYLINAERYAEAIAFSRTAVASADPAERP